MVGLSKIRKKWKRRPVSMRPLRGPPAASRQRYARKSCTRRPSAQSYSSKPPIVRALQKCVNPPQVHIFAPTLGGRAQGIARGIAPFHLTPPTRQHLDPARAFSRIGHQQPNRSSRAESGRQPRVCCPVGYRACRSAETSFIAGHIVVSYGAKATKPGILVVRHTNTSAPLFPTMPSPLVSCFSSPRRRCS